MTGTLQPQSRSVHRGLLGKLSLAASKMGGTHSLSAAKTKSLPSRLSMDLTASLVVVVTLAITMVEGESAICSDSTQCQKYSPNKIDYADADVAVISNVMNESACCALCQCHNDARPQGSPPSTNCTIAVWHGPSIWTCHLKATAQKPFNSKLVVAVQPTPSRPVNHQPIRFASIYTDHAVLQAAPRRAVLWGFANVANGTTITVNVAASKTKVSVGATLQPLPAGAQYDYQWIWRAVLPAMEPSFDSHTITVSAPSAKVTTNITDVLFGDVYVCGGQSNMEYSINGSNGAVIKHPPINDSAAEVATMRDPRYSGVRLLRSGHLSVDSPALELPPPPQGGEPFAPVVGWSRPCFDDGGQSICRVDVSATCWLFGRNIFTGLTDVKRPRPIGMVQSCWSGSPDEIWMTKEALQKCGKEPTGNGGAFNGMISPLLNTTITGAIWWQGESNEADPAQYNCTFPSMVEAWRSSWFSGTGETDPLFPFGFVMLNSQGNGTVYANPPGTGNLSSPWEPGFAGIRWAQSTGHRSVPNSAQQNTYMAVSYDTPDRPYPFPVNGIPRADPGCNVHSPFKAPPAARLARAALATVYSVAVDTVGPVPGEVVRTVDGTGLILTVKNVGQGISQLRSKSGFEVLSKEIWVSVPATNRTSTTVTISDVPTTATKLRYNWYDNPCGLNCFECAVYVDVKPIGNWSGEFPFLPLPPFAVDLV